MTAGSTRPRTHEAVLDELVEVAGARCVDIGCGSGALVRWLRSRGAHVVGVECGEIMLASARQADPDHADDYLEGVGQELPLPSATFDVAVFSYSLHHVPAPHMVQALAEAARVLRPGGSLYVVEPIATGAGHEVIKLIDDESHVRAQAQAALDDAHTVGLEQLLELRYVSRMLLDDAQQLADRVVGVDPRRADRMARLRTQFVERFNTLATPMDGKFALDQENRVRVFRKL
jgi:SAM-dependent methyltransferase